MERIKEIEKMTNVLNEKKKEEILKFCSRWNELIKKIEDNPMHPSQIQTILDSWYSDVTELNLIIFAPRYNKGFDVPEYLVEIDMEQRQLTDIRSRLSVSCAISLSKWRDKHPSYLDLFVSKVKMPDVKIPIGVNFPK